MAVACGPAALAASPETQGVLEGLLRRVEQVRPRPAAAPARVALLPLPPLQLLAAVPA